MGRIYVLGSVDDLDELIPPQAQAQTLTQARNLERQLVTQQAKSTGSSGGAGFVETLGNQIVNVLNTATRYKVAAQTAKARVQQVIDTSRNPYPYTPDTTGTASEWVPGVSNSTLIIGAVALVGLVVLLQRRQG